MDFLGTSCRSSKSFFVANGWCCAPRVVGDRCKLVRPHDAGAYPVMPRSFQCLLQLPIEHVKMT